MVTLSWFKFYLITGVFPTAVFHSWKIIKTSQSNIDSCTRFLFVYSSLSYKGYLMLIPNEGATRFRVLDYEQSISFKDTKRKRKKLFVTFTEHWNFINDAQTCTTHSIKKFKKRNKNTFNFYYIWDRAHDFTSHR